MAGAGLLHVVGYVLLDGASRPARWLRWHHTHRARGADQHRSPASHGPLLGLGAEAFWDLVGRVDVLLPNRREAQVLTGRAGTEAALDALLCARGCGGDQTGSRWLHRGKRGRDHPHAGACYRHRRHNGGR